MALHVEPFDLGERPRLLQDRVGDADLADVVEHPREPYALDPALGHPQLLRDLLGVAGHGAGVAGRGHVAHVQRLCQRHDRRQRSSGVGLRRWRRLPLLGSIHVSLRWSVRAPGCSPVPALGPHASTPPNAVRRGRLVASRAVAGGDWTMDLGHPQQGLCEPGHSRLAGQPASWTQVGWLSHAAPATRRKSWSGSETDFLSQITQIRISPPQERPAGSAGRFF